jgi:hypothetical protein
MQPTRILPDLQASLVCEEVVIGVIRVPQVPVTAIKLCVFNRWTAGVGTFTESVRFVAPDGVTVLRQGQVKFVLQDPTHHTINVTVYGQFEIATAGVYYVEVLVDEVMKLRYPLPVILQPPPGAQPPRPQ